MARRRSRGSGRKPRPEYRWAGFYSSTVVQLPTDTANIHAALYVPMEFENNMDNDVVVVRVRGRLSYCNTSEVNNGVLGSIVHIGELNEAEALVSEVTPLGSSTDWIKRNNTMMNDQHFLRVKDADGPAPWATHMIDVKVNRRIETPYGLFWSFVVGTASTIQFHFWARCLLRTGFR